MSALASISIKQQDGSYKNYTVAINDEPNKFGNNIEIYEPQTKEQRDAKEKKIHHGSGNIFWTNGSVSINKKQK